MIEKQLWTANISLQIYVSQSTGNASLEMLSFLCIPVFFILGIEQCTKTTHEVMFKGCCFFYTAVKPFLSIENLLQSEFSAIANNRQIRSDM